MTLTFFIQDLLCEWKQLLLHQAPDGVKEVLLRALYLPVLKDSTELNGAMKCIEKIADQYNNVPNIFNFLSTIRTTWFPLWDLVTIRTDWLRYNWFLESFELQLMQKCDDYTDDFLKYHGNNIFPYTTQ